MNKISQSMKPRIPSEPKACACCGGTFHRGQDVQMSHWKQLKTCSYKCAQDYRAMLNKKMNEAKHGVGCLDDKPCEVCAKNMTLADVTDMGKSPSYFIQKRTCSMPCAMSLRTANNPRSQRAKAARELRISKSGRTVGSYWARWDKQSKIQHKALTGAMMGL